MRESSYFLAMYLPLMIWIPTALFLGALVTVKLMRIMT